MRKDDCIFCKIIAGEIPSRTLYEDEQFKVIMDIGPASKGHSLIIAKDHYDNLYELPEEVAADAMKLAKKMMMQMTEKLGCDGFNILQNNGKIAGQTVYHFHMHLIPRYQGDKELFEFSATEPSAEELDEVWKKITQ